MRQLTIYFYLIILISFIYGVEFKGVVFEDTDKNLKMDPGEKGIAGVLVSDQSEVIKTDQNGLFQLDIAEGSVIFITKPAGYGVPVDSENIPQFYYIFKPSGSPEMKYLGVRPTGNMPSEIHIPLFRKSYSDTFDVILFADPQPASNDDLDYIRDDVFHELVGTNAKFGIVLGDIMYDDLSLFPRYKKISSAIGIPFYHVPGNHDMNYDAPNDYFSLETYISNFGPTYYSFDYGQVHFIVLDDVQWMPEKKKYRGRLGERQLKWIQNDLAYVPDKKLIVLAVHIPIYTGISDRDNVNVTDKKELFRILSGHKNILVLAGHMHMIEHQYLNHDLGWLGDTPIQELICAAVSGSWWSGPADARGIPIADQRDGAPNGYHVIRFEGNQYSEYFKAAGKPRDYQMRILSPVGNINSAELDEIKIRVNVFNGNEKSQVWCHIDNAESEKMKQVSMIDPYISELHQSNPDAYAKWIQPEITSHIWESDISLKGLERGAHTVHINVQDPYGILYKAVQIFEVE